MFFLVFMSYFSQSKTVVAISDFIKQKMINEFKQFCAKNVPLIRLYNCGPYVKMQPQFDKPNIMSEGLQK